MPPPAEVRTDMGSGSEEDGGVEMEEDGVETEDDGGAEEGHGRAGARVPAVAAEGDGGVGTGTGRTHGCCCVCMEPWTCYGAHRICCIPCGHVYGRACLERWLQHLGNMSAKCPQCGEQFELNHITNLYAPGNLWDGCCRVEEVNAVIADVRVELAKELNKLESQFDDLFRKRTSVLVSDLQKVYQKQLDRDVGAMVKAFVSMKEQMKKMAEQNVAPMDLIEFMEQSYTQLLPVPSRLPADWDSEALSA